MAGNGKAGDDRRHEYVGGRSQSINPKAGLWTKRDTQTGKFKGIRKEGNNE